ncbi:MAG: sporulation-delaying protein SdpB family protein [Actinomycetales bacterium]
MNGLKEQLTGHLPRPGQTDGMVARYERTIRLVSPFGPSLGVARTLLALGTAGTLLLTPTNQLFFRSENYPTGVVCSGPAASLSLFCVAGDSLALARGVALVVLGLVILGILPALTAIPHWWVTWSLYNSSPIPDGGDHVAGALTLLLAPMLLFDRRLWHWRRDRGYEDRNIVLKVFPYAFLVLIWVQVAGIYAHAAIAKLGVEEWSNGTALWYWIQDPTFSPADPVFGVLFFVTGSFLGVILLTYGSLALEFGLMFGLFAPRRVRGVLWIAGLSFHAGIGVVFGLWSFFCSMAGALTLYLIRPYPPRQDGSSSSGPDEAQDRADTDPGRRTLEEHDESRGESDEALVVPAP